MCGVEPASAHSVIKYSLRRDKKCCNLAFYYLFIHFYSSPDPFNPFADWPERPTKEFFIVVSFWIFVEVVSLWREISADSEGPGRQRWIAPTQGQIWQSAG